MPNIIYVEADGTRHEVELEEQTTLMEGATMNLVPSKTCMRPTPCSQVSTRTPSAE